MTFDHQLPPLFGVLGLVVAFIIYVIMTRQDEGGEKIKKIADAIHKGAMVFMHTEYRLLFLFAAPVGLALWFFLGGNTALSFAAGAASSALAGYLGMFSATKANVRTTAAAQSQGQAGALTVAFYGGSIMGLCVASLGLLGLGSLYWLFGGDPETAHAIHGFGMGGSVVALFSRVGGGIFTKSADVGADLVGKLEAGIPEDDPRNPGVIADNVGDNVGDVAGMGSDIFESYCGSMIATIAIASTLVMSSPEAQILTQGLSMSDAQAALMSFPLALSSFGLICSIIGILIVRARSNSAPEKALRMGHQASAVILIAGTYFLAEALGISTNVWYAMIAGTDRRHDHWPCDRILHRARTRCSDRGIRQNRHCNRHDYRISRRHGVRRDSHPVHRGHHLRFNRSRWPVRRGDCRCWDARNRRHDHGA